MNDLGKFKMAKTHKFKIGISKFLNIVGLPGAMLLVYHLLMLFLTRQRSFDDVGVVDVSATAQIILAIFAFFIAVREYLKNHFTRILVWKSPLKWLLFYGFWGMITTLWSVDPAMTVYRAFESIAFLLLLVAIISRLYKLLNIRQIIQWVMYYAVFVIIINLFKRWYAYGLDLSVHTLLMEQMGSTPYFFLALLLPVGWLVKLMVLPISIFSLSNIAYVGMLLGTVALFKGNRRLRILFLIGFAAVLIAIFYFGFNQFLMNTVFYEKKGIGFEYTSGRNQIIKYGWNAILKQPFTGYGFMSGETFIINEQFKGAIGAHNGLLSALLGGGFPAVFLFMMLFLQMSKTANSRYLPAQYKAVFLATVILITIHTMGNPGIGSRVYGTWIPSVMILTLISMVQFHYKYATYENNLGNP